MPPRAWPDDGTEDADEAACGADKALAVNVAVGGDDDVLPPCVHAPEKVEARHGRDHLGRRRGGRLGRDRRSEGDSVEVRLDRVRLLVLVVVMFVGMVVRVVVCVVVALVVVLVVLVLVRLEAVNGNVVVGCVVVEDWGDAVMCVRHRDDGVVRCRRCRGRRLHRGRRVRRRRAIGDDGGAVVHRDERRAERRDAQRGDEKTAATPSAAERLADAR